MLVTKVEFFLTHRGLDAAFGGELCGCKPSRCRVIWHWNEATRAEKKRRFLRCFCECDSAVCPVTLSMSEWICTCCLPVFWRAVAGVGRISDCRSNGQSDFLIYMFTISDVDAKIRATNVGYKLHQRMHQGFFHGFSSAHVRWLKLRQAAPAKLGRSLYYVWYLSLIFLGFDISSRSGLFAAVLGRLQTEWGASRWTRVF